MVMIPTTKIVSLLYDLYQELSKYILREHIYLANFNIEVQI